MIPASVLRSAPLTACFLADDPDALARALASVAEHSCGRVRRPDTIHRRTGKPEGGGLHCARIFGPIEELRCLCGRVEGAAREGEVCDRCGVLCGRPSLRQARWGHVESPVPLLHPGLLPTIADALGVTRDELDAILKFEANLHDDGAIVRMTPGRAGCMRFEDPEEELLELRGPRHVARRLGADASRLLVTRVPVTPPAWRWTRQDPQDSAYMALVNRCSRLERLIELNAPRIILINEERMTQLALERVCEVVRRELLALLGWRPSAPVSPRSTALLRAVYADPDLDEPREAFAEHLAAQGDERGEFIRLQLEDVGRRRRRAPRRERDLLRRHHDEWLAPLERAVERVEFRRGFPCSGRTVRARAEPLIGDPAWSTFEELETELPALIAHPGLPVLRKITCSWGCFAALAEQDRRLTELGAAVITPRRYPPTRHAQVVRSPVFPALRELTVIQRSRRAQDWGWLLASPLGARLEELTIALPHAHLEALSLLPWCALLRPRLRLALSFGRPLRVTLELDERDRVEVSVATTRAFAEYVALGDGAIARELARALLELEPDRIASLRLRSRSRWYGEALESLAAAVLDRFGDLVTLPRFYEPPTSA